MMQDQSSSLGFMLIFFPAFCIISGVILGILFWKKIVDNKGIINKLLIFFSTPLALLTFEFFRANFTDSKYIIGSREYDYKNERYREITYDYSVGGQTQRIEFYKLGADWEKDSIWIYYNKDGSVNKKIDYRKK